MAQIGKYWDKLFADPIEAETPSGKISIQPQWTNKTIEHFFRDLKREIIKKTGKNYIGKAIRAMIAALFSQKPGQSQVYENYTWGEKTLEDVFAFIDSAEVRKALKTTIIGEHNLFSRNNLWNLR